jgi:hypothetical protein
MAAWQYAAKLGAMQQTAETPPIPGSSSFAGLLASLAAPAAQEAERANDWPGDDLGEDVVTLSYERALRAHSRHKPADDGDWTGAAGTKGTQSPADARAGRQDDACVAEPGHTSAQMSSHAPPEHGFRTASVTIRLSKQESARLRQRAAEAGLTMSAYLRSCVLDADALRAQVKKALAELRVAESDEKLTASSPTRRQGFGWLARIWPHWQPRQRVARA